MFRPDLKCPKCSEGMMKLVRDVTKPRLRAICTLCRYEGQTEGLELNPSIHPTRKLGSISLWYSRLCPD